jgi:SAM-dependent methyltransferase
LIEAADVNLQSAIIDIGGGASRLVDELLERGWRDVSVLDISAAALHASKLRLGKQAEFAEWIVKDVTRWKPARQYDVWHDRAAFHFLTNQEDREAYVESLEKSLAPAGQAIIGTFALDGPDKCSRLPVCRYDGKTLSEALGKSFRLVETRMEDHWTPWQTLQRFQFSRFVRASGLMSTIQ